MGEREGGGGEASRQELPLFAPRGMPPYPRHGQHTRPPLNMFVSICFFWVTLPRAEGRVCAFPVPSAARCGCEGYLARRTPCRSLFLLQLA